MDMDNENIIRQQLEFLSQVKALEQMKNIQKINQNESLQMQMDLSGEEELMNRNIIFLNGEINDEAMQQITTALIAIHFDKLNNDEIQIILNSPGGYLLPGWAIIDVMKFVKNPIRTIALGSIASMATMIFIAGDHRVMAPHSHAMIHEYSGGNYGTHGDLLAERQFEDRLHEQMIEHLIDYGKLKTKKQIREKVLGPHDKWLTPKEMLNFGFCDEISVSRSKKKRSAK